MEGVAWIEAATIGPEAAHETWALAARQLLEQTAATYHAVVTTRALGDAVQECSRIRTKAAPGMWLGDVLFRVTSECFRRREPNLAALCVLDSGFMPEWYADTVLHLRGTPVSDPDQHAAEERLSCYQSWAADLPADGGVAALPPRTERLVRAPRAAREPGVRRTAAPREAKPRKVAATDVVPKICPTCFMALPASGLCDNCD